MEVHIIYHISLCDQDILVHELADSRTLLEYGILMGSEIRVERKLLPTQSNRAESELEAVFQSELERLQSNRAESELERLRKIESNCRVQ